MHPQFNQGPRPQMMQMQNGVGQVGMHQPNQDMGNQNLIQVNHQ